MKTGTITGFITPLMTKSSLLCAHNLRTSKGVGTAYEDGDADRLFLIAF
jgi:hypothetical protein